MIKKLFDQIEFLKQESKTKETIIELILENYRQTVSYESQTVKETVKQSNHSEKGERK